MKDTVLLNFPKTGRVGRFIKVLQDEIEENILLYILEGADKYESFSNQDRSAWWNNSINRIERELGVEQAKQIMYRCGAKCCGNGQRDTARRIMKESGSLKMFLEKISKHDVKEGDLTYTLEDENTIIAEHNKCFCKQVARTREPFDSHTYCHCSVEFNRQFFTSGLGKPVQVELLQSIICGAKSCKFKIQI